MIPTYNCADYLVQTLNSLLQQDPGSDEMQIEVVDDCSTKDDPEAVVQDIGKGRVSFFRQPQNCGAQANFTSCIRRAQGHWVHILHGDDTIMPGFYASFRQPLEEHPELGAAFCRLNFIDEHNQSLQTSVLERETPGILENWIDRIAVRCRLQFACIVVKRSTYEKLGGFHADLKHTADWEMWKRIASNYPVWYEPSILACYRKHSASDSSRLFRSGADLVDIRKAIEISKTYLPPEKSKQLSAKAREYYALRAINKLARRMLEQGDVEAATAQIREALYCSTSPKVMKSLANLMSWSMKSWVKQIAS
jgi:glycosyltransferase involved in cell wall biosynthesis